MRYVRSLIIAGLTALCAGYLWLPASITVGSVLAEIPETRGYVVLSNIIGAYRGNVADPITGQSYYWTPLATLEYRSTGETSGLVLSEYTVSLLLAMDDQKQACAIAQAALDLMQQQYWHVSGLKIACPLRRYGSLSPL